MSGPATTGLVHALTLWCERNGALLRAVGVALGVPTVADDHGGMAGLTIESAHALLLVEVRNHMGMCDVHQMDLSTNEIQHRTHESLGAGQLEALLDGLVARLRRSP